MLNIAELKSDSTSCSVLVVLSHAQLLSVLNSSYRLFNDHNAQLAVYALQSARQLQ